MGFSSPVSSLLQHNATQSVSAWSETAGGCGACALLSESSFGGPAGTLDAYPNDVFAERTRIAQELHDTLLQGFFAVSMQIHAAVDHLPADSAARLRFTDVLQLLDRVLEQGRCAVRGLRASDERSASLAEALARIPNELGLPSTAGFRVVVHGREKELKAELRNEVYRIGREAIINACRHSRARDIETEVRYGPTELRVAVRDNGRGIDPRELRWGRDGHWGLRGMRERAERIGARLCLRSGVALGTEVELRVPSRVAFEHKRGV